MESDLLHTELTKIIETSNNNITITDQHGIILRSNPNHWSIYGIEPNQYIGKSVYQLQKEGILSPSIHAMVLESQKPVQILQKTKTGRTVMATGFPVFDQNGEIIRAISYSQDQTEIFNLQEQYKDLEKKLVSYQTEVEELRGKESDYHGILYRSSSIEQIVGTIYRVSKTDASVLLLGPSGVGKSTFARMLHAQSNRKNEPFIEVDCSTIPETLFESEMFGYDSGSFTGASKHGKQGLIEQAEQGTLFLDEIGELPLAMQSKLLRVLQEKKVMRVGGKKERQVNFRLITATNKNIEEMVENGEFRLDLFYRINIIPLQIPPLKERKEDLPILIQHYLQNLNEKYQLTKKIHASTYDALTQYSWPGNVRELENILERVILTADEETIRPEHLPVNLRNADFQIEDKVILEAENDETDEHDWKNTIERTETQLLKKAASYCKTTYEMADYLGISQPSVVRKLKQYNINRK
ncbi:AAA family ATPase [Planococcus sp. CPCC 101016]|uniref:sigma-54 interaction domain-containing protein n=1 Tax=Planococcus sp. CPCC 101016 TaxID=2599617 RepID=UPI0011B4E93B|nr:sigma 54-interacting transcriptional regulator [Planococcus sp. CPCC 101016]TWT06551.1 AAA family ATPase [Planococcus sp. CPCC 101016]